jgi:hypothetical protein
MPDADLRHESIVDCTAPSDHYDLVIDRAALSSLSPKDLKRAFGQIRRIMKPGGVFFFNPYGVGQTRPFHEHMPPQTLWDPRDARRLFPDNRWELLDFQNLFLQYSNDPVGGTEHTLRITVRKI